MLTQIQRIYLQNEFRKNRTRFALPDKENLTLLLYPRIRQNLFGFFELECKLDIDRGIAAMIHFAHAKKYFQFFRYLPSRKDLVRHRVRIPDFLLAQLREYPCRGSSLLLAASVLVYNFAVQLDLDSEITEFRNPKLEL